MYLLSKNTFGEDRFILQGTMHVAVNSDQQQLQEKRLELERKELLGPSASLLLFDMSTSYEESLSKSLHEYLQREFNIQLYDEEKRMFNWNVKIPEEINLHHVAEILKRAEGGFYGIEKLTEEEKGTWIALFDDRIVFSSIDDRLSKKYSSKEEVEQETYRFLFEQLKYNNTTEAKQHPVSYYLEQLNASEEFFVEVHPNLIVPNSGYLFDSQWKKRLGKLFEVFGYGPIQFVELV